MNGFISTLPFVFLAFPLQGIGDMSLAFQCFKLALANNNDHAEAYNNLAVLEMQKGRVEQVGVKFQWEAGAIVVYEIVSGGFLVKGG